MLGGFPLAKYALHCISKYITGSGFEDLPEPQVSGNKVLHSVLSGTSHVSALQGMLTL